MRLWHRVRPCPSSGLRCAPWGAVRQPQSHCMQLGRRRRRGTVLLVPPHRDNSQFEFREEPRPVEEGRARKRRLLYDLRRLSLPLVARSGVCLRFQILSEENTGQRVVTGQAAGLITLNLAEADDAEREARRLALREPYRTLLGHFRHEAAHFYWDVLIAQDWTSQFRLLFGDERQDYHQALSAYYEPLPRAFDAKRVH